MTDLIPAPLADEMKLMAITDCLRQAVDTTSTQPTLSSWEDIKRRQHVFSNSFLRATVSSS